MQSEILFPGRMWPWLGRNHGMEGMARIGLGFRGTAPHHRQFEIQGIGQPNGMHLLRTITIRMKPFSEHLMALRTFTAQIAGL
jgi:hypothetical protein